MPKSKAKAVKETRVVVKLSGSLFFARDFAEIVGTLRRIVESRKYLRLVLVAGGGKTSREYIEAASKFGADQASLDEIGIHISRANAMVLICALGEVAHSRVPSNLQEVMQALEIPRNRIVVVGGFHPGQSTNAVAALIAEKTRASRFINATDTDAVYTEDPNEHKNAKPLTSVTIKELSEILGRESMRAGGYDLMDPVALKLIERSRTPTLITKCTPKILEDSILFGKSPGTVVSFAE